MRIVLKPAGAAMLLLAIATLVFLLVKKNGTPPAAAPVPAPAAPTSASPTAKKQLVNGVAIVGSVSKKDEARAITDPLEQKWALATESPAQASVKELPANDVPGTSVRKVSHLTVSAIAPEKPGSVQIDHPMPRTLEAGHKMALRFWARSRQSSSAYVTFEQGEAPFSTDLSQRLKFTPDWQEYTLSFATSRNYTVVPANVAFKAGLAAPGELDIAGVRVIDYGK